MKKFILAVFSALFLCSPALAADPYFTIQPQQTNTGYLGTTQYIWGDVYLRNLTLSGTVTTDILFEGTTDDTSEVTLDPGDPKVDNTVTFNQDVTGRTVLAIGRTYSETTVYNATKDAYTLAVADLTFKAGDVMTFKFAGNKSAGNGAASVILYIDDAAIVTLAIAAATVGDFTGEFTIYNTTAATQKCSGNLNTVILTDSYAKYAADTTNFADGLSTNIKVQIVSGHASDLMTMYYVTANKE